MGICPLLNKDCLKEKCEWFFEHGREEDSACSIWSIQARLVGTNTNLNDLISLIRARG